MARFKDNGDGTVTDTTTGLQWQKEDDGVERDYKKAESYAGKLKLGGHRNWRLPEKDELVELAGIGHKQLKKVFSKLRAERYWAKTRDKDLSWSENPKRIAYTVDFDPKSGNYGQAITYFRVFEYYVIAVRGG